MGTMPKFLTDIFDTLSDVSSSESDVPDTPCCTTTCASKKASNPERNKISNRKRRSHACPFRDPTITRYWNRRYELFERFDLGVQIDKESWYGVTPESIARHQAKVMATDLIIDVFAGVGGNSIQFAQTCGLVLSIEHNFSRLLLLKHNSQIYGVQSRILPVCGDAAGILRCLRLAPQPHCDAFQTCNISDTEFGVLNHTQNQPHRTIFDRIFMSPPWGGPGYTGVVMPPGSSSWNSRKRRQWFHKSEDAVEPTKNLDDIPSLSPAVDAAIHLSPWVVLYLPRNLSIGQMLRLGWPSTSCTCEHCSSNKPVVLEEYWIRGRRLALGLHIGGPLVEEFNQMPGRSDN